MRAFFRKLLILIAAYSLALQPAFAAISVAHTEASIAFCAAGSSGGAPAVPADTHKSSECCTAMGCGASSGGVPAPGFHIAPAFNTAAVSVAVAIPASRIEFPIERPRSARAPPV